MVVKRLLKVLDKNNKIKFLTSYKKILIIDNDKTIITARKKYLKVPSSKWDPKKGEKIASNHGITIRSLGDGQYIITGKSEPFTEEELANPGWRTISFWTTRYEEGHKYLAISGLQGGKKAESQLDPNPYYFLNYGYYGQEIDDAVMFTATASSNRYDLFYFGQNVDFTNRQIIRPQIYDLTEIYGKGNEPETYEDFKKDFPKGFYRYREDSCI